MQDERTYGVVFPESHQPKAYRCHAGMANKSDSFIGCFETRLFIMESFDCEVQDIVCTKWIRI